MKLQLTTSNRDANFGMNLMHAGPKEYYVMCDGKWDKFNRQFFSFSDGLTYMNSLARRPAWDLHDELQKRG